MHDIHSHYIELDLRIESGIVHEINHHRINLKDFKETTIWCTWCSIENGMIQLILLFIELCFPLLKAD